MSESKTVLLVDDEQGILDAYEGFLTPRPRAATRPARSARMVETSVTEPPVSLPDYRFLRASSGEEALELLQAEMAAGRRVACGFFDMKMPGGLDGLATIKKVRALDPDVLVTIVTAYQDRSVDEVNSVFYPDHQDEWDYLSKPFTKWEVVQKCRQMVESWNRRRREDLALEENRRLCAELEALNQGLEMKVSERTLELVGANVELEERNAQIQTVLEELQCAQSQLVQQEKMASVGQLAAGVAHEINNPVGFVHSNLGSLERYLSRIRDYISRLDDALLTPGASDHGSAAELAEARRALRIDYILEDLPALITQSRDGTDRIKTIVQNLKTFSHPGTGEATEQDVNAGLQTTVDLVSAEFGRKCSLVVDLESLPDVRCNASELNQVWMNLLINAGHAIDDGLAEHRICVTSCLEDGDVVVRIEDDGCGMDEVQAARVFEPFFTTKEIGKGTGLGLSVAYGIIRGHGGDISVESEEGVGTCFKVRLPVARSFVSSTS